MEPGAGFIPHVLVIQQATCAEPGAGSMLYKF